MSLRIQRCGLIAASGSVEAPLPEGVLYNLGALPTEVSTVLVWPTLPTTTSTATVTTLAELQAAVDIDGARVTVDGTIVGTATIRGDDVEIVGTPGSSVGDLNIERDTHRVRIADLTARSVNLGLPLVFDDELGQPVPTESALITDVVIDGVTINNPTENGINCYGRRVAVLNCNITANWYSLWVGATGAFFQEDIIVANCEMDSAGTEATMRILQTQRNVVVDCTLTNASKHNWRLHQGTTLAYCGRNTLVNGGIMLTDPAEPTDTLGSFWFDDNDITYTLVNGVIITLDPYTRIDAGEITDNTFTMSGATVFTDIWSYGAAPGDWDLTGNVIVNP